MRILTPVERLFNSLPLGNTTGIFVLIKIGNSSKVFSFSNTVYYKNIIHMFFSLAVPLDPDMLYEAVIGMVIIRFIKIYDLAWYSGAFI